MNIDVYKNCSVNIFFLIDFINEKFENVEYVIKRFFIEVMRCDILM